MGKIYKIVDILHSGEKGTRGERVDEEKYEGMIGSLITPEIPFDDIRQFDPAVWTFIQTESKYQYFHTSSVFWVVEREEDGLLEIETFNSVYLLEEIKGELLSSD